MYFFFLFLQENVERISIQSSLGQAYYGKFHKISNTLFHTLLA